MTDYIRWTHVASIDEMEAFYRSIIPAMRVTAREWGYALGVHGSLRRDLDLVAVRWVSSGNMDLDALAGALQLAACGMTQATFTWAQKPCGRRAVSFPVCLVDFDDPRPSVGHVDLSVVTG